MAKNLTYDELIELAKQNYNNGGDVVYECWDERFFEDFTRQFGPITEKKALAMFKQEKELEDEEEAARRWYSGENYEEEEELQEELQEEEFQDEEEFDDYEYCPSATAGDYSPSNPWDAPGMSIRDFI